MTFNYWWPLILAAGAPFLWWMKRHTRARLEPSHLMLTTVFRTTAFLFLVLALMQPIWHRSGKWLSLAFVLDVSQSIAPESLSSSLDWIEKASNEGQDVQFVAFAASSRVLVSAGELRSLPVSADGNEATTVGKFIDQDSTNLEGALYRALQTLSADSVGRLVLISDGRETLGDSNRALWEAEERGVRIFTVPASTRKESSSWVETVEVPDDVRAGEPIEIGMRLFSRESRPADVIVNRIDTDPPQRVTRRQVQLETGWNRLSIPARLDEAGPVTIEALVEVAGEPVVSRSYETLWVGDQHRVLFVEGNEEGARFLRDALREGGFDVTVLEPSRMPERDEDLESYDAVIVSDVPAERLNETKMEALSRYVRDKGGGLIFIGGQTSFGDSGYADSLLEEILPIDFEVQEKRKEVALIIVLDKSYSMKGEKIELAKEATKAAMDLLEDTHFFGVVSFDWYPHVTVPLQLAENRTEIGDRVDKIGASAPTRIYPALEKAYEQLKENESEVKHVILLSDGKSHRDEFEKIVKDMAEDEITLSTVAVGDEADRELLTNMAEWGNGRSYFITDAKKVPEVFIREAQLATEATLAEEPFHPIVTGSIEALDGTELEDAPALKGHVNTRAKPSAEVILASEEESPILARWYYGLGRAVVFTSDAKNRWASDWLNWDGFGKFWSQLVRETVRQQYDDEIRYRVRRVGNEAIATLVAVDEEGKFQNGEQPRLEMTDAAGEHRVQAMQQTGPGTYEARLSLTPSSEGKHRFLVSNNDTRPDSQKHLLSQAVYYPFPDEYQPHPANHELLRHMSELSGGKFDPTIDEIFSDYGDRAIRPTSLWPFLAVMALIVYLLDVSLRRAPWLWEKIIGRGGK